MKIVEVFLLFIDLYKVIAQFWHVVLYFMVNYTTHMYINFTTEIYSALNAVYVRISMISYF